jgi:hypothetical protein
LFVLGCGNTNGPSDNDMTLGGTIADSSGAAIAEAAVALSVNGATAQSGPNGDFSMTITGAAETVHDTLIAAKNGYFETRVALASYKNPNLIIILNKVSCLSNTGDTTRYTLLYPNGGEVFYMGDSVTVRFIVHGWHQPQVDIFTGFGLQSVLQLGGTAMPGDTMELGFRCASEKTPASEGYHVNVSTYNQSGPEDRSDCFFAIREQPVEISAGQ